MFEEPTGWELPPKGFEVKDNGYLAPEADGSHVQITVNESSERLQLLSPFVPLGNKIEGAKLLIKAFGKCTTDHISITLPVSDWSMASSIDFLAKAKFLFLKTKPKALFKSTLYLYLSKNGKKDYT